MKIFLGKKHRSDDAGLLSDEFDFEVFANKLHFHNFRKCSKHVRTMTVNAVKKKLGKLVF